MTSTITENTLPDRWAEHLSSLTIFIPEKWAKAALVYRFAGTCFEFDLTKHLNILAEGFAAFTNPDGFVPHIFIKSAPAILLPKIEMNFWNDGIPALDEDGECSQENIILTSWQIAEIRRYAAKTFRDEARRYFKLWMKHKEEERFAYAY